MVWPIIRASLRRTMKPPVVVLLKDFLTFWEILLSEGKIRCPILKELNFWHV